MSIAPLGRPVVPDVYMINATSRSSISTGTGRMTASIGSTPATKVGTGAVRPAVAAAASGASAASVAISAAPLSART